MKDKKIQERNSKYLFFDFDGTLTVTREILEKDGKKKRFSVIPEEHYNALLLAKAEGYRLFLCTGRAKGSLMHAFSAYPYLKEIPWDGMICGASEMWYHGKQIAITVVSEEECMKWIDYAVVTKSEFHYNGTDRWENLDFSRVEDAEEIERMKNMAREWIQCNPMTNCAIVPAVNLEKAPDSKMTVINMPTYSDLFAPNCNKGRAIVRFCELLGIPFEDTVCFGDSANDLDMFHACPIGICMANSPEELKSLAAYVAKGTYGVEEGIYWLLGKKT